VYNECMSQTDQRDFDRRRKLQESEERLRRGPVLAFDFRDALGGALEIALRRLRPLPTAELTDTAIEMAFQVGSNEISRYIAARANLLADVLSERGLAMGSHAQTQADQSVRCGERAREELRLELRAYRAQRLREAQAHGGAFEGRLPGEITFAEASKEYGVSPSAWTVAAGRPPSDPRYLPHRRVGRNVLVQRNVARKFAEDHEARQEQQAVGSKQSKH
jgi:hypothetical protein